MIKYNKDTNRVADILHGLADRGDGDAKDADFLAWYIAQLKEIADGPSLEWRGAWKPTEKYMKEVTDEATPK